MSFKQVSFRNWKLADLVSRKLACGQHSSNHPVLEFSNCLSYLPHSRASDARFLKALSCPPDWHPLYSSTLAGQASAAFWHRDERSSMVTFFTKCSHYTSLVSNKVTIVLNSASESNHWTVLGSALNHNVGITAVGVHEVEHVGGLATMATINLKKVLGAGSPKSCKKGCPRIIDWWNSYLASHSYSGSCTNHPHVVGWRIWGDGWGFFRPWIQELEDHALEASIMRLPARPVLRSAKKVVDWKTSDHQLNIKAEQKFSPASSTHVPKLFLSLKSKQRAFTQVIWWSSTNPKQQAIAAQQLSLYSYNPPFIKPPTISFSRTWGKMLLVAFQR